MMPRDHWLPVMVITAITTIFTCVALTEINVHVCFFMGGVNLTHQSQVQLYISISKSIPWHTVSAGLTAGFRERMGKDEAIKLFGRTGFQNSPSKNPFEQRRQKATIGEPQLFCLSRSGPESVSPSVLKLIWLLTSSCRPRSWQGSPSPLISIALEPLAPFSHA